jgi:gliding motility-associated-like protein
MKKSNFIFSLAIFLSLFSLESYSQAAFTYTLTPATGCRPVTVNFLDGSAGATSWSWDFDDGSSPSPLQNPSIQYATPGVYHVTLTINGGTSQISHDITVYDIPVASFTISDTVVCAGEPVTFTSTSYATGGATLVQYEWAIEGSFEITTTPVLVHSFTTTGTQNIVLTVTDSHGCVPATTEIHTITVIPAPIANFTMNPPNYCGSQPISVTFANTTAPLADTYTWNFGDPASGALNTSTAVNESHTFNTQSNYTITLTATSGNCTSTSTQTFYWQNMTADFSVTTDTVCFYDTVYFTDLSSPPPSSWGWNFGDPGSPFNTAFTANPMHSFSAPGLYTVTLNASSGTCPGSTTMQIYVRPQPVINFTASDSTFCDPSTVVFTPASTPAVGSVLFDYDFPLNDTGSTLPYTHNYSYGAFDVLMILTDIYGCKDTLLKQNYITIIAPQASFSPFSPDSGCVPLTINFDGISSTSPADPIVTYLWDFGDGDTAITTSSMVSHTYTTTGIWDVTLTVVTASGCTATVMRPQWERAGLTPTANFSYVPAVICYGDTVQFTDLSTIPLPETITGWLWDFGDGGSSLEQNPEYKYDQDSGLFTVTLIVYDNGCPDTIIMNDIITVHPPKPDFQSQTNCATPLTVNFISTSHGADSLVWDWADGSPKDTANNTNLNHTFPARGDYWVKITAWNYQYGCMYTDSHLVQVRIPIAVIQVSDTAACYPATLQFNSGASQDAASVSWDFGDPASGNNTSTLSNPIHLYNIPADYTVTLVVTDIYGCTSTVTKVVHIQGPYVGFTVNNTTGCTPLSVQFTDTTQFIGSPVLNYHWNFNYPNNTDILDTTAANITHIFGSTNTYTIELTVTDMNGCVGTANYSNFISSTFPNPQLLGLDTFLCPGSSNTFAIQNPGSFVQTFPLYSVTWNFGDGTPDTTVLGNYQVNHTYTDTADDVYLLTVTVTDSNGCVNSATQNITVLSPSAAFDTSIISYRCGLIVLSLNGLGVNDYISNYDYTVYGPANVSYHHTSASGIDTFALPYAGHYYAVLTVTNPGCSVTDTLDPLALVPGPSGYFSFDPDTGCSPLTVTFHVNPGPNAVYIEMNFADGNVVRYPPTDTIITHTYYGNNGQFWNPSVILGTSNDNAIDCRSNAPNVNDSLAGFSHLVTIINPVNNSVTIDTIMINEGEMDTLTSIPGYDPSLTYSWTVGPSGDPLDLLSPPSSAVYTANEGDEMILFMVTDVNGCQAYDTVYLVLHLCEKALVIPNVFTPGGDGNAGDGKNDSYYIKDLCPIEDFRMTIFNRWGNIVYETTDYAFKWDGTDDNGKDCSEGVYYYTLHAKRSNLHGYIHLLRGKTN